MSTDQDQFSWAVKNGDLKNVEVAVKADPSLVKKTDANGRNPCHWAADYNQAEILDFLISKGAKFNDADGYGITPLLAAVYENHVQAVELLLKRGAKKDAKGPDGQTAYEAAEKEEIKKLLK
ncbi:hypothetical protein DICPUDRAFT_54221 [Dictyostelium purpureum]|uniref:Uncharacterized protein n=1 Tax=Dictyostelium purpureum TaxID=5786 RepID=F0ZG34_DICPU|nr:uncharacterized protein DICPUDRAFT_54221 [Dictyostelium purpureum]EGC37089.1 hypothetical protein DICPUDRAFT_54221 [Dictyostelium purpureum]|eukprot:XP_003286370.1 hypothetical protein DICPUDRAFT_54221 [Dictyostelium purpureum]